MSPPQQVAEPIASAPTQSRSTRTESPIDFRGVRRPTFSLLTAVRARTPYLVAGAFAGWLAASAVGASIAISARDLLNPLPLAVGFSILAIAAFLIRANHRTGRRWRANENLAQRLEELEDRTWEVRESEEIHRSMADAFGDVLLHRDETGTVTFANIHFDRYFDEPPVIAPSLETPVDGQDEDIVTRDVKLETKLGTRWFSWSDMIVRDPATGIMGERSVARDITDRKNNENTLRKALERAEAANETKSRFLAMVSHEIRTPLNGVIGMAKLLDDTELKPAQKSYVDAIKTSGGALLSLIEDLLDTSRIEAGHLELQTEPTDLRALVENVSEIVSPRARDKKLGIATFIDPALPEKIELDPHRLRQVLLNLVGNAVKFTETGGIGIFARLDESAERISICVKDSGPGIPDDQCQSIFEDFTQASTGATRAHEGVGLGLSISRQLVSLMGGDINVTSVVGTGSSFTFDLPLDMPVRTSQQSHPQERPVVLQMADTPTREALVLTLAGLGYSCSDAQDATDQDALCIRDRSFSNLPPPNKAKVIWLGDVQDVPNDGKGGAWLTWPVRAGTLQRVLAGRIASQSTSSKPVAAKSNSYAMNVLVAEDNQINAMLVKALLGKLGHEVTHVTNGRLALDVVTADPGSHDVVLMDLHMPEMDGLEAIRKVRSWERSEKQARHHIVVLSADGQKSVCDEALAAGADGFLTKPLDLDHVSDLLEKLGKETHSS